MEPIDSRRLVGLLADENRRRVVAALVLADEPLPAAALAEAAGVELRAVVDAVDRLGSVEMVSDEGSGWVLDGAIFQTAARAEAAPPAPSAFDDQPEDIAKVLDSAFRDGQLVQFPSKRSRRLVVLDHLAQQFEIGQHYPEAEINDQLRQVHDDVAMLRRWLVDEQFMDRSGGMYWRCGGSV